MRLWTLHPKYLDRQGLLAVWREGLLAQAVLLNRTRGYRSHPQLMRFKEQPDPAAAIGAYLAEILQEAQRREYRFDGKKIHPTRMQGTIEATEGQLLYEWDHLLRKLRGRSPDNLAEFSKIIKPEPHPLFTIIPGGIQHWERQK